MSFSFDERVACIYGVEEAIMIQHFQYWLRQNKANGNNLHDGKTWCWNSVEAITKYFPFWGPKTVRRVLESLKSKEVIVVSNHNKTSYDRTLWYAFADEAKFLDGIFSIGQMEKPKRENRSLEKGEPIPINKPVIDTVKGTERSGDARHAPLKTFIEEEYRKITGEPLPSETGCWVTFAKMLKKYRQPEYSLDYFRASWTRFLKQPDKFFRTQASPLRFWASRPHAFSANLRTERHESNRDAIREATQNLLAGDALNGIR